ncbi:MAG: NUDIX domain-containing protein [Pseudomonadota bacterium]
MSGRGSLDNRAAPQERSVIADRRTEFPVVVHVLVFRTVSGEEQLYLQRRANTQFLAGWFVPPGGHVEGGELPLEAAIRELREETGLKIPALRPRATMPYRTRRGSGINLVFQVQLIAPFDPALPALAEPESADLAVWVPLAALPIPCPAWVQQALAVSGDAPWYVEVG